MIAGANCLYDHFLGHFLRFGLHIHIGRGSSASKTEAMYCPARGAKYEEGDTSNFDVADGYIGFSDAFKYLGAIIDYTLTSEADITSALLMRRWPSARSARGFSQRRESVGGSRA